MICAYIILKEFILKRIVYSIIIGWIGIVLVSQPEFTTNNNIKETILAIIIAILGALMTSLLIYV